MLVTKLAWDFIPSSFKVKVAACLDVLVNSCHQNSLVFKHHPLSLKSVCVAKDEGRLSLSYVILVSYTGSSLSQPWSWTAAYVYMNASQSSFGRWNLQVLWQQGSVREGCWITLLIQKSDLFVSVRIIWNLQGCIIKIPLKKASSPTFHNLSKHFLKFRCSNDSTRFPFCYQLTEAPSFQILAI